jgi:hypothetical protein
MTGNLPDSVAGSEAETPSAIVARTRLRAIVL